MPKTSSRASQEFVPIKEVRDGIVILKNGSLRLILMASSLNFALKSQDEQTAIIMQYQNFLNSLDFYLQILVRSRPININSYIDYLKETEKTQTNELLKIQTREYIEFIKTMVETTSIVSKSFYISVPFNPPVLELKDAGNVFVKIKQMLIKPKLEPEQQEEEKMFEEYREQLIQRGEVVRQELSRLGVRTAPLDTEEVIELFYELYNPGEEEKSKIPIVNQ